MNKENPLKNGVLLINFRQKPLKGFGKLWSFICWHFLKSLPRNRFCEFVGRITDKEVWLIELPWQEEEFALLSLERQRNVLCKILLKARASGAKIAGMPMVWREVLGGRSPMAVADGKMLSVDLLLEKIKIERPNIKDIAVIGMDYRWTRDIIPKMVLAGFNPILSGTMASAISESLYRKEGLAVAVLNARRASEQAELSVILKPALADGLNGKTVVFKELSAALNGAWYGRYSNGIFPAALASAIISIGGTRKEDLRISASD